MKFGKPISREKAAESAPQGGFEPWPPGEYEFVVLKAEEGRSKAGNDQLVVTLECYSGGKKQRVWDYLGAAENMQWKVRQFFECLGMIDEYESAQDIDPMRLEGRPGRVWLNIDKSEGYDPRNKVGRYIFEGAHKSEPTHLERVKHSAGTASRRIDLDDDAIPF